MITQSARKEKYRYQIILVVILMTAFLLLPQMFGNKISISPFVLFVVAIVPNLFWFRFNSADSGKQSNVSSRTFFQYIFASAASAFLIVIIYRVAYSVGSGG